MWHIYVFPFYRYIHLMANDNFRNLNTRKCRPCNSYTIVVIKIDLCSFDWISTFLYDITSSYTEYKVPCRYFWSIPKMKTKIIFLYSACNLCRTKYMSFGKIQQITHTILPLWLCPIKIKYIIIAVSLWQSKDFIGQSFSIDMTL